MATYKKRRVYRTILITANILLIVGLAVFGGLYFKKYQDLKSNPPSSEELTKSEIDKYVKEIKPLYNLPSDETPQLATVKDKDKLKDQPFFDKAENGDITLIYTNAKLAILYRPSTKQIINVSTVSISDNKPNVKVIGKQSDRDAVENKIKQALSNEVAVVNGGDAKGGYSGVVIVDISSKQGETAKKLAQNLGGQVGTLPSGEDKPEGVDILVIAGAPTP